MEGQNIILIGFMGAGKTSVGDKLAGIFHKTLIDTDQMIEDIAGMPIAQIFKQHGETPFRQLETRVLKKLLEQAEQEVISVGGGLPMREENRVLLQRLGKVVYLKVKPETVLLRLMNDTTRPLLQGDDVQTQVYTLLADREPIYREAAHLVIEADGKTMDEIAREIMQDEGEYSVENGGIIT